MQRNTEIALNGKTQLGSTPTHAASPIIGITAHYNLETEQYYSPDGYARAVQRLGGIAIIIPALKPDPAIILDCVDGLIFAGGGDIDPALYGGSPHPTIYGVDQERDATELALVEEALRRDKPILGICRGLEMLVVATGGQLVADVPEEFGQTIKHRIDTLNPTEHEVEISPDSRLARIIGRTQLEVVSWHHQGVRTVPEGWQVTAKAADGVIEALEREQHPFAIALQWHPEMSSADPWHQRIFEAFIEAARSYKALVTN